MNYTQEYLTRKIAELEDRLTMVGMVLGFMMHMSDMGGDSGVTGNYIEWLQAILAGEVEVDGS